MADSLETKELFGKMRLNKLPNFVIISIINLNNM